MIKIIFDQLRNQIDHSLYLLPCIQFLILVYTNELNNCLWKDDFADLEIDLLVFEDLDLVYPTFNTHVLEDVYGEVYDNLGVGLGVLGSLGLLHLITKYIGGMMDWQKN